jgi:hypothetical protein
MNQKDGWEIGLKIRKSKGLERRTGIGIEEKKGKENREKDGKCDLKEGRERD